MKNKIVIIVGDKSPTTLKSHIYNMKKDMQFIFCEILKRTIHKNKILLKNIAMSVDISDNNNNNTHTKKYKNKNYF